MNRRVLAIIFCFLGTSIYAKPIDVQVSASSAILINAKTGQVLFEKDAYARRNPASTTKIGTAIFLLEQKRNLNEITVANQDCIGVVSPEVRRSSKGGHPSYRLEHRGTHAGIKLGEKNTLRTLLYGLILVSGNDAANVIAHHVSGSVDKFMEGMNAFFKEKGLTSTHFSNPHGLYHEEHYTTAFDMAKLTQYAMQNPTFREVVKTTRYPRPETNKQPASEFITHNRLLKSGKFYYPKAIGVKTGTLLSAGSCLVSAAQHEGRELICVVLNCPTSEHRFTDAITLFEKAFSEVKTTRKLFTKDYDVFSKEIEGAERILEAVPEEDVYVEYFPSEEPTYKTALEWRGVNFPIEQGQEVAVLKILNEKGVVCKQVSLLAKEAIKGKFAYVKMKEVSSWIKKYAVGLSSFFLLGSIVASILYVLFRNRKKVKTS